jgi:hypothetical protein
LDDILEERKRLSPFEHEKYQLCLLSHFSDINIIYTKADVFIFSIHISNASFLKRIRKLIFFKSVHYPPETNLVPFDNLFGIQRLIGAINMNMQRREDEGS